MFSASTIAAILYALAALPAHVVSHNYVMCTNAKPPLEELLSRPTTGWDDTSDQCSGYPRAMPLDSSPAFDNVNDQGYPWQYIWSVQDNIMYHTHRVCNWLQQNPVYESAKSWTVVKPGSTFFVKVQTNNHAHEYAERPSGHYKIYLAGSSGTQLTTANQLTDDRVVFKAPANKYAHIVGTPNFGGYDGDPGFSWLPFKTVDPTGAALPPGVYNYIWTYWWSSGDHVDYMIPAYSTSFDIEIRDDAEDGGYLTQAVNADPNYHITLIGNTTSPGGLDHTSPWPPYAPGYLDTGYDGGDPDSPDGKRTFKPLWTEHVDAQPMPAPSHATIPNIKDWTNDQLEAVIPLPPGSTGNFPGSNDELPSMPAGSGDGGAAAVTVTPDHVSGGGGSGGSGGTGGAGGMGGNGGGSSIAVESSAVQSNSSGHCFYVDATSGATSVAAAAATETPGATSVMDMPTSSMATPTGSAGSGGEFAAVPDTVNGTMPGDDCPYGGEHKSHSHTGSHTRHHSRTATSGGSAYTTAAMVRARSFRA